MPQPIELHFWPTPNGYKPLIALIEMDFPYVIAPRWAEARSKILKSQAPILDALEALLRSGTPLPPP